MACAANGEGWAAAPKGTFTVAGSTQQRGWGGVGWGSGVVWGGCGPELPSGAGRKARSSGSARGIGAWEGRSAWSRRVGLSARASVGGATEQAAGRKVLS